jgi:hypothetical protein
VPHSKIGFLELNLGSFLFALFPSAIVRSLQYADQANYPY